MYHLAASICHSAVAVKVQRQHILLPHILKQKKTGIFIVSNFTNENFYEDSCNFIHIGVCYVVGAESLQQQDDK